ncbi:hypothetical protein BABINDRAFT_160800 [Babjeviella inositovora NRRL Y-12698]|uniref:EKC/KEOPS complex subunit BUD32 n=1 Tax=Babjeviella inositovora NRRL Y-12698 TaxID=984486 RepID=A0A1E3QS37_9ASCO|nr:uncharacterized protein BABINDRAFT_160800 [Babjeviella inositovora NRRL Y-12698]ODQ80526.1 hypothetical protein BABINDRAFT_160800 [Babjeviella inositovora NRRL Y-12698]
MASHIIAQAQAYLPNIPLTMVSQGAEALVFTTTTHPCLPVSEQTDTTYIIKYRPSKPYRHPKLDAQITKHRTISEAKIMHKLGQLGIRVPRLVAVDAPKGIIWMHFVGKLLANGEMSSLKNWLWYLERVSAPGSATDAGTARILTQVGREIGRLHMHDIVHGDLTTSNILLEQPHTDMNDTDWEPVLIDYGLGSYSGLPEDKAVDLYVLERALLSTHPVFSEKYNAWVLEGYALGHAEVGGKLGGKKCTETLRRLDEVRMRGRKRSLLG